MVSDKELLSMTGVSEMQFAKHNDTDYESFREFKKQMDGTFSEREKKQMKLDARRNVIAWERTLPERWRNAVLSKIEKPAAKKANDAIKNNGFKSFFLHGDSGTGKTYVGYAIVRQYVGKMYVTPSQVKLISEEALMGLAKSGFEGRKRVEELFNSRYKLYVIDNAGAKGNYREWELELWEQLIEHIYTKDLKVIFTSLKDMDSFANKLSDSAYSKISYLVGGNALFFDNGVYNPETGEHEPVAVGGLFSQGKNSDKDSSVDNAFGRK